MQEEILFRLAAILVLGIGAQWIAWRSQIPSILLLLVFGFIAGPITGYIVPSEIFGELLMPMVSASVAIILFEGGLGLHFRKIPGVSRVIFSLVSIGLLVTWGIAAFAAKFFLGLSFELSVMLGAVLTVSGPTVVLPLLRQIRPKAPLSEILRWEGILIDPVGALVAVLVFEALLAGEFAKVPSHIALGVGTTIVVGGAIGFFGALFLATVIRRHLIPDYLENSFVLMSVVFFYALSNHFHTESGLFAATLLAILLANKKDLSVHHILTFKEDLSVLIISSLFIILSASVNLEDIQSLDYTNCFLFLAVLIFVARPASVFASTIGTDLSFKEKIFLSWVAPRGIVAAAVATVFSFGLMSVGFEEARLLAPYTFMVIVGTVVVYGLSAGPLGRWLGVSQNAPGGIVFLGGNAFALELCRLLRSEDVPVLIVDSNSERITEAVLEGIPAHMGDVLVEPTIDELPLDGMGMFVALTPNDEANSLSVIRFSELFPRSSLYQLSKKNIGSEGEKRKYAKHLRGRSLFSTQASYPEIARRLAAGQKISVSEVNKDFNLNVFHEMFGEDAIVLASLENKMVKFVTTDVEFNPPTNGKIIVLSSPQI